MTRWPAMVLLLVVGVLLYGYTLHAPFYLDDVASITENPLVKDLPRAAHGVFAMRGLSILTFALNYHLSGLDIPSWHLVNIAIHLAASCLVLLLIARIFPARLWLALFGALLFIAHPLQTQGVTYLVQRMTSLSALLFLLALYLFVLARERLAAGAVFGDHRHLACYAGALVAGGLSLLAKETTVVLPFALVLFARFFLLGGTRGWRPLLAYTLPFLVLPIAAGVVYFLVPAVGGAGLNTVGWSGLMRSMEGNSPLHYLATQCSILWIYLRMLALPYGQALDHGYPISRALLTFASVAGGLGLAALGFSAWWWRQRFPEFAFAVAWFFLTLAVESSVIPLDPLFEHRLYLPMFGFVVFATALLKRIPSRSWQLGVGILALLLLAQATWRRNLLWNDPVAFYTSNLAVAPDNERVYFNLGQELLKAGRVEEGELMVRESIARNPARHLGYLSLKELYLAQDRLDEAIGMLHYGLDHVAGRDRCPLLNDLAFIYGKKGDFANAIAMLQRAIEADPQNPASYFNLAQMLMYSGQFDEVEYYLRKTLELDPGHTAARAMLEKLQTGR